MGGKTGGCQKEAYQVIIYKLLCRKDMQFVILEGEILLKHFQCRTFGRSVTSPE
jgi:hypothetical protein